MYQCWIENEYGEQLELTNNQNYTIYQIDGLNPPAATINTSPVANFDGEIYNSSKANKRNIVIYLTIEGDCEVNRINLYKYARSKRAIRFYYKNNTRNVYIDGYVESIQIAFFEMKQNVQISIVCPAPWFKSINTLDENFSSITPLFVFPFAYEETGAPFSTLEYNAERSIINEGDIENGIIIQIKANGTVLNPAVYNLTTGEFFKLAIEMNEGDEVTINTNKSFKKVTLTSNGITSNIINDRDINSKWFQLVTGDNIFMYDADEFPENISCTFTHINEFEGV